MAANEASSWNRARVPAAIAHLHVVIVERAAQERNALSFRQGRIDAGRQAPQFRFFSFKKCLHRGRLFNQRLVCGYGPLEIEVGRIRPRQHAAGDIFQRALNDRFLS